MLKYILGLGIILIILIIGTLWFSQNQTEESLIVPVTYTPTPTTPTTILPAPDNFAELLPTTPTNLFQNVLDQVHLDTFFVVSCGSSNATEKAILLTAKYVEAESGNNFDPALKAVSDWESNMLVDVGKIIFPDITSAEQAQPVVFTTVPNTEYRIAPVTIAGKKTSLHYGWENNYLLLASTKECLGEVLSTVQEQA